MYSAAVHAIAWQCRPPRVRMQLARPQRGPAAVLSTSSAALTTGNPAAGHGGYAIYQPHFVQPLASHELDPAAAIPALTSSATFRRVRLRNWTRPLRYRELKQRRSAPWALPQLDGALVASKCVTTSPATGCLLPSRPLRLALAREGARDTCPSCHRNLFSPAKLSPHSQPFQPNTSDDTGGKSDTRPAGARASAAAASSSMHLPTFPVPSPVAAAATGRPAPFASSNSNSGSASGIKVSTSSEGGNASNHEQEDGKDD